MTTSDIERDRLASGISWLLGGIALIVLDLRVQAVDVLFDPVGAVVVAVGVGRVVDATPSTPVAGALRLLAWVHVALLLVLEVGVLAGQVAVGGSGLADMAETSAPWRAVAAVATTASGVGVVLLASHLRRCLTGVAADRWRQVWFAWLATLALAPLGVLVGALELAFLTLAIVAIAGVLLLVALFATRRAAEEDDLDRDFAA